MSAHEWKWLETWGLWENLMLQSPLKSSVVLFLQNWAMTRVYFHLVLNSGGLCWPRVSNFTLMVKFVRFWEVWKYNLCSFSVWILLASTVPLSTQETQHIRVDYSDKTQFNTVQYQITHLGDLHENALFWSKFHVFRPLILSSHANKNLFLFLFFTVQPSWIMLLCSDWMVISQGTENSKVPSHEISRCARVQLSICQWEKRS